MLIQASGLIDGPKDVAEFLDAFTPWLESKGWSYAGAPVAFDDDLVLRTQHRVATNVDPKPYIPPTQEIEP